MLVVFVVPVVFFLGIWFVMYIIGGLTLLTSLVVTHCVSCNTYTVDLMYIKLHDFEHAY